MPNVILHPFNWTIPFRISGLMGSNLQFLSNSKSTFCKQNSSEPDQTPRSVAFDLVLHCLPVSYKKGAY